MQLATGPALLARDLMVASAGPSGLAEGELVVTVTPPTPSPAPPPPRASLIPKLRITPPLLPPLAARVLPPLAARVLPVRRGNAPTPPTPPPPLLARKMPLPLPARRVSLPARLPPRLLAVSEPARLDSLATSMVRISDRVRLLIFSCKVQGITELYTYHELSAASTCTSTITPLVLLSIKPKYIFAGRRPASVGGLCGANVAPLLDIAARNSLCFPSDVLQRFVFLRLRRSGKQTEGVGTRVQENML